MRRERPSRPKPQSVVMTSRSGEIYSSAFRISPATYSAVARGAFEGDDVGLELQQMGQGALVARHFPIDALLIGIAPAGMHPDLGVDAGELPVERLGLKLELGIAAVGP